MITKVFVFLHLIVTYNAKFTKISLANQLQDTYILTLINPAGLLPAQYNSGQLEVFENLRMTKDTSV